MLDKALADPAVFSGRYAGSQAYDALSDGALLKIFGERHEEAAFAALVRRHGPMVLGVCRRVLRHAHDAEDAFQATFLVLVEKAPRLRRPELLANWLYGVAYRTALHARVRSVRRSVREREAAAMTSAYIDPEIEARELRRVLDEELHRLPEKFRAPLVLCYLEGKTNDEAARLLGWRTGSMSYRLARGRDLLRERLEARLSSSMSQCLGRGSDLLRQRLAARLAALSGALPAIWLAECAQPEFVSPLLATTTVQAAVTLVGAKMATAASGLISASVRDLMEETLRSLTPSKWTWWISVFFIVLILSGLGGAGVWVASGYGSSNAPSSCTSSH